MATDQNLLVSTYNVLKQVLCYLVVVNLLEKNK